MARAVAKSVMKDLEEGPFLGGPMRMSIAGGSMTMSGRAEPQGPARTRIFCELFFHPQAVANPEFDATDEVEFWDMTNRQDWPLCTLSQQGISWRGYTPGPCADLESQLAAFDREHMKSLGRG